jgi:hypothetical protein
MVCTTFPTSTKHQQCLCIFDWFWESYFPWWKSHCNLIEPHLKELFPFMKIGVFVLFLFFNVNLFYFMHILSKCFTIPRDIFSLFTIFFFNIKTMVLYPKHSLKNACSISTFWRFHSIEYPHIDAFSHEIYILSTQKTKNKQTKTKKQK